MRRLFIGLICCALVQSAALQPARTQPAADRTFRVAWLSGLTGPTAAQQQAGVTGAQLAAKELNAHGGILGRQVEITVFDHQFDPARAVRILQDDVLTKSWELIYPGGGYLTTAPMLPFVTKAKVFAITTYNNIDPAKLTSDNPYFFDIQPPPPETAAAFADYLSKLGVKKLAVLYQSDGYGLSTDRAYEAAVKKLGIAVVAEPYDIATVDVTPTLLKLKAENPDRLFAIAFGAPAGHVLNSMDKLGWDIPVNGDLGMGITDLPAIAPARSYSKLLVQTYRANVYVAPAKRDARLNAFITAIKATGPMNAGLSTYTFGWDVIMLAALAAKKANSVDPQKMTAALEHLDLPPNQRPYFTYLEYNFTPASHQVTTGPREWPVVPYTPLHDGMIGS